MEKVIIITESKKIKIENDPEKGYIITNSNFHEKMHWSYLLCGGFIVGISCSVFIGSLWLLSHKQRQQIMVDLSPKLFIKKCWGYW